MRRTTINSAEVNANSHISPTTTISGRSRPTAKRSTIRHSPIESRQETIISSVRRSPTGKAMVKHSPIGNGSGSSNAKLSSIAEPSVTVKQYLNKYDSKKLLDYMLRQGIPDDAVKEALIDEIGQVLVDLGYFVALRDGQLVLDRHTVSTSSSERRSASLSPRRFFNSEDEVVANGTVRRSPTGNGTVRRSPTGNGTVRRSPTGNGIVRRSPTGNVSSIRRSPTGNTSSHQETIISSVRRPATVGGTAVTRRNIL